MTDIVERLRERNFALFDGIAQKMSDPLAGEAADEIERLRSLSYSGRNAVIEECAKIVDDMRIYEAGLFDESHSGARGESRSNALYDAHRAIRALVAEKQTGAK